MRRWTNKYDKYKEKYVTLQKDIQQQLDNLIYELEMDVNNLIKVAHKLNEYKNHSNDTWKKMRYMYWLANKTNIYEYNSSSAENLIDTYEIEMIVMNEGYYLTEFEILLLAEHYEIKIILVKESIKNKHFGIINTGNIIANQIEKDNAITILFSNYYNLTRPMIKFKKIKMDKQNKVPSLGIVQYNSNAFINSELVEEMVEKMVEKKESTVYKMASIIDIINKSYEKFLIFADFWKKVNAKMVSEKVKLKMRSAKKLSKKTTL